MFKIKGMIINEIHNKRLINIMKKQESIIDHEW